MINQERLIDHRELEVRRVREADDEILTLLQGTVLGSEGGMRYVMMNTPERVRSYGSRLLFLALYKSRSLKGVIGLCRRRITTAGTGYDATYLRYLAMNLALQTKRRPKSRRQRSSGEAATFTQVEKRDGATGSFKERIISLLRDPSVGDLPGAATQHGALLAAETTGALRSADPSATPGGAAADPAPRSADPSATRQHVIYAYVESRNERSRNLIHQAGYEHIRSFLTVAFSRFNPVVNPAVELLSPEEEPAMAKRLEDFYHHYSFYTDEFSFHDHKYYVMRHNGEIVAGACAIPARYRMVNVPGIWGWLMMRVLPFTPYFRRLFQPESFRYVILNAIWHRHDSESLLPDLFEGICAREGYNTAITWLDDHSALFETLRTNRKMGALNRMLNAKPGLVYAHFTGVTGHQRDNFFDLPAYISGFDFS